jgi:hypothetical protein
VPPFVQVVAARGDQVSRADMVHEDLSRWRHVEKLHVLGGAVCADVEDQHVAIGRDTLGHPVFAGQDVVVAQDGAAA